MQWWLLLKVLCLTSEYANCYLLQNMLYINTYIGYLCGQCSNGKGVSALLNKCVSCEKTSVLLIIALGKNCLYVCITVYLYV